MNWELFGIVLIWIGTIWHTLLVILNLLIIWEHNTSVLVKAKLQGTASFNNRGIVDIIFMVIGWAFLAVYYFG